MIIAYRLCSCYVWPIDILNKVGKCGRCNSWLEEERYKTKEEALQAYRKIHGRNPRPIQEK